MADDTDPVSAPPPAALERAKEHIQAEEIRLWRRFAWWVGAGVALIAIRTADPKYLGRLGTLGIGVLIVSLFFVWSVYRLRAARKSVLAGPYQAVRAVGWTRPPDGCNYGLFRGSDARQDDPDWVLRLPLKRHVRTTSAILCGTPRPGSYFGGLALIDPDGSFLAAGRIVGPYTAQKRWERRTKPTPWWADGPRGRRATE